MPNRQKRFPGVTDLEGELASYIESLRARDLRVTCSQIQRKELELYATHLWPAEDEKHGCGINYGFRNSHAMPAMSMLKIVFKAKFLWG